MLLLSSRWVCFCVYGCWFGCVCIVVGDYVLVVEVVYV